MMPYTSYLKLQQCHDGPSGLRSVSRVLLRPTEYMTAEIEEVKVPIKSATTEHNAIISEVTDELCTFCKELNLVTIANRKLEATYQDLCDKLNRLESNSV